MIEVLRALILYSYGILLYLSKNQLLNYLQTKRINLLNTIFLENKQVIMTQQVALQKKIAGLPKVIQDIIGEFNSNHRLEMKAVFSEIIEKYGSFCYYTCDNWECSEQGMEIYGKPIVVSILFEDCYFCCEQCADEGDDNIRRAYRRAGRPTLPNST